jgi:hypothetical protein
MLVADSSIYEINDALEGDDIGDLDIVEGDETSLKIPKRSSESVNRRRTDNTMNKSKRTKGQTKICKEY